MEKLRAYRLRRRIAVPLMLAFSVLWLGTMALLTASTQDRLDITVQRIYKDARDDLEEQWSYYEANLENGLGAEAEHIMVDNLSSSSLALTDIAEGGMAFVTRDEENHVIQSQLAWGYGHEADVDMGQRWHLRFDNGLDDAGLDPTDADIERIKLGQVPQTLLADSVHYTAATKTVIGTMLYKKMIELGILEQ